jgi:hypothetical protein
MTVAPAATELRPYRVEVPQADLDDLAARLSHTRFPDELPGAGWSYGVPLSYLRELVDHWSNGYDWRAHEARITSTHSSSRRSMASRSTSCTCDHPSRTPCR